MSNFNIMGSYSGIDMSVIDQMIEAEKSKGVQFTNRKDKIEREQGAWKDVGSRLNSLTQKADALNKRSTFESRTVNSTAGDKSAVSVTAGNSAPIGNYQVRVQQLATSSRLIGEQIKIEITDPNKNLIDQKLGYTEPLKFINGDGEAFEIKVEENDSLRDITRNINVQTKKSGIEASIIDNRLVLKDTKMGKRNINIEQTATAKNLGFGSNNTEAVASRLTGHKVGLSSFENLNGTLKLINDAGKEFNLDVSGAKSLVEIVNRINGYTDEQGKKNPSKLQPTDDSGGESGIKASIVDSRLVLTDTSTSTEKGNLTVESFGEGNAAEALGFSEQTNYTFTGEPINEESIHDLSGNFTIQVGEGEESRTVKINIINVENLEELTEQITQQAEKLGISASINQGKLVLAHESSDLLTITSSSEEDIINKIGLNNLHFGEKIDPIPTSSSVQATKISESAMGQNAIFTVDGIEITRDTNRISDAIEGVAFTLKTEHIGDTSEVISITNNTQKGVDAMKEFVDQYNSVVNFIQTQTEVGSPGEENNTVGALVGEGSIMRLQSGLRSTLMQRINGKSIADFGVEIDRYGVANLDEAKLNQVLQEDPTSLSRFFYRPELSPDGISDVAKGDEPKDTQGMSELFKNFLETYTSKSKGIISTKQQSYERMVKSINEQIDTFNERIDRKRDRYIRQFSALDTAMMRAESQMEYLYSQMNIE